MLLLVLPAHLFLAIDAILIQAVVLDARHALVLPAHNVNWDTGT